MIVLGLEPAQPAVHGDRRGARPRRRPGRAAAGRRRRLIVGIVGALVGLFAGARAAAARGAIGGPRRRASSSGALLGAFLSITFGPRVGAALGVATFLAAWPVLDGPPRAAPRDRRREAQGALLPRRPPSTPRRRASSGRRHESGAARGRSGARGACWRLAGEPGRGARPARGVGARRGRHPGEDQAQPGQDGRRRRGGRRLPRDRRPAGGSSGASSAPSWVPRSRCRRRCCPRRSTRPSKQARHRRRAGPRARSSASSPRTSSTKAGRAQARDITRDPALDPRRGRARVRDPVGPAARRADRLDRPDRSTPTGCRRSGRARGSRGGQARLTAAPPGGTGGAPRPALPVVHGHDPGWRPLAVPPPAPRGRPARHRVTDEPLWPPEERHLNPDEGREVSDIAPGLPGAGVSHRFLGRPTPRSPLARW